MVRVYRKNGFTLIELLMVVAIIGLLLSLLLPSLSQARMRAKVVKAHAELRGITLAMDIYKNENNNKIPPTRFSCNLRSQYDLPVELLPYLPKGRKNDVDYVEMFDPFTPTETYKYRAPGPAIVNESTINEKGADLWIPDGFPGKELETGKYCNDPKISPVRYAVWSYGPDPNSPFFDIPGRLPVPKKYWLGAANRIGVIVHYEDSDDRITMSP